MAIKVERPRRRTTDQYKESLIGASLGLLSIVCIVVLSFQSCGKQKVKFSNNQSSQARPIDGGNGTGYDGKVYVESGQCPDGSQIKSRIIVNEPLQKAALDRENCQDLADLKWLVFSDLQFENAEHTQLSYQGSQFSVVFCNPGSTLSCAVKNGAGIRACSSDGTTYGVCTIESCEAGFVKSNGACVVSQKVFAFYSATGCGNGYCAASRGVCGNTYAPWADELCKMKGFAKASGATSQPGPASNICEPNGSCFFNQNPTCNRVFDQITCINLAD